MWSAIIVISVVALLVWWGLRHSGDWNWLNYEGMATCVSTLLLSRSFDELQHEQTQTIDLAGVPVKATLRLKNRSVSDGSILPGVPLRNTVSGKSHEWVVYVRDARHLEEVREAVKILSARKKSKQRNWFPWRMVKPPGKSM